MKRASIYDTIRVVLVALGICSTGVGIFAVVLFWSSWRMTEGVVKLRQTLDHPVRTERSVDYTRANGVKTSVPFAEESLPASAQPGSKVVVAYDADGKSAFVYTFRSAWQFPAAALVLGSVLSLLGLYFRPRRKRVINTTDL